MKVLKRKEKMVKGSEMDGVEVPEAVIETLNRTLESLQELETELPQFLSLSDPDFLAQLPYLERAHSLFSLAKLASTLFSCLLFSSLKTIIAHPFFLNLPIPLQFSVFLFFLFVFSEVEVQRG